MPPLPAGGCPVSVYQKHNREPGKARQIRTFSRKRTDLWLVAVFEQRPETGAVRPRRHNFDGMGFQVGIDLVSGDEVAQALLRHGDRYLERVYPEEERAQSGGRSLEL